MKAKFELGQIVATPAALKVLEANHVTGTHLLARHMAGDWGDLDAEDAKSNDEAIAHTGDDAQRVLSAYKMPDGSKVWIITEWDRSVTTILLPSDY